MRLFCAILLLLAGCAMPTAPVKQVQPKPPMPPVPVKAAAVPRITWPKLPPAPSMARISLAWNNNPSPLMGNWITGLEATTNLSRWYVLFETPYSNSVPSITNTFYARPLTEFYRAYNRELHPGEVLPR